jgi:hypothetical protein
MKKKCLTATAKQGVFIKNPTHKDIYDLMPETGSNLPFSYFRLSLPIKDYLMRQGAKYVAESHKCYIKVLHTGLKPTNVKSIYSGDIYNSQTKTRSLIIFHLSPDEFSFKVYLFDGYFPKNINKVLSEIVAL